MPTEEGTVLATCKGAATYARKADAKLKEIIDLLDGKLSKAREVLKEVNSVLSRVEVTSEATDDLRNEAEKAEEAASSLNKTFADQLNSISSQKALTYRYLDDVSQLLKAIDGFQMPSFTKKDIQSRYHWKKNFGIFQVKKHFCLLSTFHASYASKLCKWHA